MAKKRKIIDWEAIEREYRAGMLSVREIARRHKITDAAIHMRIKRDEKKGILWQRDLTGRVRERVRAKAVSVSVSKDNVSDEEIIEEAANQGLEIIQTHRKDIARLCDVEQGLLKELQENPTKLYLAQYQGKVIEKTVGLTASERAQAAANLAQVQHKRIALERQAFSLDEPAKDGEIRLKVIYDEPRATEAD